MTGYPVIMNGDHAEFEKEHANTPPKERPDWPLPSFDAKDWAEAFCRRFIISERAGYDSKPIDDDVGLMLAWFANALMRGFDEHAARIAPQLTALNDLIFAVENDKKIYPQGGLLVRTLKEAKHSVK